MSWGRIARTAALAALLLGSGLATDAHARPWAADYPWQADPTVGYEGWTAIDTDPNGGPDSDWYRSFLGGSPFGRGLAAQPLGGQLYNSPADNRLDGGPRLRFIWATPGNSRITSATFRSGELSNQPGEGQYLRARVYSATNPTGGTQDFGDALGQPERSAPYTDLTATVANDANATQAEGWLFTTCPSDPATPGTFICPTISTSTDSYGRWGDIRIALDDPDDPDVAVTSDPPIGAGWTNKRRAQRFSVTARDGSSGIARLRTQVQVGASTRTLSDRNVTCDPDHRTAGRQGLVCPIEASSMASDPGRDSSSRDRRYTVTATDYAGNIGSRTFTLRRDFVDPSGGRLSGELAELTSTWTNLRGAVSATVRASDRTSGVGKIEITAQRQVGGRTTVLASTAPDCADGCRAVSEKVTATLDDQTLPKDGRYRLAVRVTDRAGNVKSFRYGSPLKIDRQAPRRVGKDPVYRATRDGQLRVIFDVGRDPQPGSGVRLFVFRYFPLGATQPRSIKVTPRQLTSATRGEIRYRKSRGRVISFKVGKDGIAPDRPIVLGQLDAARGSGPAADDADGEQGNALFQNVRYYAHGGAAVFIDTLDDINQVSRRAGAAGIVAGFFVDVVVSSVRQSKVDNGRLDPDIVPACSQVSNCGILHDRATRLFAATERATARIQRGFDSANYLSARQVTSGLRAPREEIEDLRGSLKRFITSMEQVAEAGAPYAGRQAGAARDLRANLKVLGASLASTSLVATSLALEINNPGFQRRNPRGRECWQQGAYPRAFTDSQKRWNLCVITKRRKIYLERETVNGRSRPKNEAHHIFPRKFQAQFARAGIPNVNYPFFLCWQRTTQHRSAARAYNERWERELADLSPLTVRDRKEILEQGLEFASGAAGAQYGCIPSFRLNGGAANLINTIFA